MSSISLLFFKYKLGTRDKDVEEPTSPSDRKQDLMDEILNILEAREEMEADNHFINNPNVRYGEHIIPSLPTLYVFAFKRLQQSARFWRKEFGVKGYLKFLSQHV